ncbi:hypothetical protein H257_19282, partial [Aphanomyces astaci]
MRMSIPKYNVIVQPITDLLESVYKAAGGRTRQKVAKVVLADVGWNAEHVACLTSCKDALGHVVTLAHPKPERLICVFADASDLHWGGVVTQIPHDQVDRELDAQDHEPLMFLSGATMGYHYLFHKPDGFALFTDHANLKFIFNPASLYNPEVHYSETRSLGATTHGISPLRNGEFTWPTMAEIVDAQVQAVGKGEFPVAKLVEQQVEVGDNCIFEIQNLVTGVVREAHSSRLKFYADDALEVTEELLRHIAHNADGHVVDHFLDCRYNDRMAVFEVCVRWRGLQAIEDSWEPADNLLPTDFKRYVRSNKADPQVKAMATALGLTQSLGGIVANLTFAEPLNPSQE